MFPCYNMATTLRSSPLEKDIVLAAAAGFRHIELRKEKLLDYLRRGNSLRLLRQLLEENGLKPICINALPDISFHTGQARVAVAELCHFLCYAGQYVGCRDLEVIAAFDAPTDDREAVTAETAGVLTDLARIAADYHMRLALEYMGLPKNSVRTFDHALEIVNRVGLKNVGLLPDTWHHFAGGSRPEDLLKAGPKKTAVRRTEPPQQEGLTLADVAMDIADCLARQEAFGHMRASERSLRRCLIPIVKKNCAVGNGDAVSLDDAAMLKAKIISGLIAWTEAWKADDWQYAPGRITKWLVDEKYLQPPRKKAAPAEGSGCGECGAEIA